MVGKIRGHYRINSSGQVIVLSDVNAVIVTQPEILPVVRNRASGRQARIKKLLVFGFSAGSIMLAAMSILPQIERSMVAADARRVASARMEFFRTHPEYRPAHWTLRYGHSMDR